MASRAKVAAASVALLLAVACGSTAPLAGGAQQLPGQTGNGSLGGVNPSAPGAQGGSTGVAAGPTGSGSGVSPTSPTFSNGTGSTGVGAAAPGVTATKIHVGILFSSTSSAGNSALGATGTGSTYDARDLYNVVIKYVNAHGGIAGRQLVPVYYDLNVTNPRDNEDQAACEEFKSGPKVFSMGTVNLGIGDILRACAEKIGAISFGTGDDVTATFTRYPHFLDPVGIQIDRLGPATVNGLYAQGFFTGLTGLVTWDLPQYRQGMQRGYVPTLRAHNVKFYNQIKYISPPSDLGGVSGITPQVANAVLDFQSHGVDHVVIQDGPAGVMGESGLTFLFMNEAASQQYKPRYGGNTHNGPGWEGHNKDQMDHMLAIEASDIDPDADEGWRRNKQRDFCYKLEADAGYPVGENTNNRLTAADACDTFFFLRQVLAGVSAISSNNFVQRVAGLGTSFRPASVYGTRFFPGRRDGGDLVRVVEYLESCDCLRYKGPPFRPE